MAAPTPSIEAGDLVWARQAIVNDGHIPGLPGDALLAGPGSRGMVILIGHAEAAPDAEIYLVRFEDKDGTLGPPVGCLGDELTQDGEEAKQLAGLA